MTATTKPTGGPAFPIATHGGSVTPGMTMRDWFAGQAAQGLCTATESNGIWRHGDPEDVASRAYAIADAMIAERAKP